MIRFLELLKTILLLENLLPFKLKEIKKVQELMNLIEEYKFNFVICINYFLSKIKTLLMNLVTGGTGLLGSHLLYYLVKSGEKTRAIKRKHSNIESVRKLFNYYSPGQPNLFENIEWLDGDVLDIFSIEQAMQNVDYVYHCAAMVSFSPKDSNEMLNINSQGTSNVVNMALEKGIKKLCHVSSIAALGRQNYSELINEECWWKDAPGNSNYAKSKYASEREVWRASEEGLEMVIVNPSIIIGPGNWNKGSSKMFQTSAKGLKYYSEGTSGFVDVRDVALTMIKLINSDIKGERFILNGENSSYRNFFNLIHDNFGTKRPYIKANKLLSEIAWRMDTIKCFLSGESPLLTKESARSAHNKHSFSNQKTREKLQFEFMGLQKMIDDTCLAYKYMND